MTAVLRATTEGPIFTSRGFDAAWEPECRAKEVHYRASWLPVADPRDFAEQAADESRRRIDRRLRR